ncbi:MAG: DUF5684 domain-containing protein [Lachnospiraceae bacterium]|nr:DUF5684 domain-containing protein [Lachnospiraceae bacterium]
MDSYDILYASAAGASIIASLIVSIISLIVAVITLVGLWKMFTKAGKPGWACIIPFYSQYCQFEMAWGNGWLFLLMLIPCVNIVVMIMLYLKMAKAFGQGIGFGIGLIFLTPIFTMILGFGSAKYIGPQE